MKRKLIVAASCLVIFGLVQAYASEDAAGKDQKANSSKNVKSDKSSDAKGKVQTICPVNGGDIDRSVYIDFKGKRIYLGCERCLPAIKANPEKYIKIMETQGVEIEKTPAPDSSKSAKSDKSSENSVAKGKAQTICPVMGAEIDKKLHVDVKGKRIYIGCEKCYPTIKADPDKYIKILEDQGIEIERTPAPNSK